MEDDDESTINKGTPHLFFVVYFLQSSFSLFPFKWVFQSKSIETCGEGFLHMREIIWNFWVNRFHFLISLTVNGDIGIREKLYLNCHELSSLFSTWNESKSQCSPAQVLHSIQQVNIEGRCLFSRATYYTKSRSLQ